jgi:signal peptidase I
MRSTSTRTPWAILAVTLLLLGGAALVFYLTGGRWFTVLTPSMATYAPVGTFVLSATVAWRELRVGDMILFHPPGVADRTYFHRVVSIAGDTLKTKGDLGNTPDPWSVDRSNLVGREVFHIVGMGSIIHLVPLALMGSVALFMIVRFVVRSGWRFPAAVLGASMVATLTTGIMKPFVSAVMLDKTVTEGQAAFLFVPTGLFRIISDAPRSKPVVLDPGEVGEVIVKGVTDVSRNINIVLTPSFTAIEFVIAALVCGLPIFVTMVWLYRTREKGTNKLAETA